ncbi:acyl-CoA synthetase [Protofrankia symbiont of Coriaria ruscifolia]|uniref:acyl-CoA synthetase n=1 Tax=Protofrankia symbiont of Coriaria ruscifolia TaxID=1306542 RepID=UPI0010417A07|nr:acyl-CoA synthetase [Protofrankia symbiont of Coriaria ruscifolia]
MYPGEHAARTPAKPAVVLAGTDEILSYADLEAGSVRLARYLHEAGLRRGDRVALLTDNGLKAFEVYWATQRSGLYLTAVNRHLSPAEIAYIVNDCGARVIIVSAALATLAAAVVADTPSARHRLAFGGDVVGHLSYEAEVGACSAQPLPDQPRGADMLYSSGTTGRPKGVMAELPDRQVHEPGDRLVALSQALYGMDANTVYLSPAPIYHAAPLRYAGVVQSLGGTVVLMERFDAEQALGAIERFHVTHSQWVPTMLMRMFKLPAHIRDRYDLSSMRVAIHAAAPCPVELKRAIIDWWGPILHEYYSSTEGPGATFIASEEWLRKPGSVGHDGYLGTVRICGQDGEELPAGEIGTIYFERDELPFHYHNDPAKTAAAQHPRHPTWTTTGDVGYLDSDRYLFLTDRESFMIISGGMNIYPQEVEDCLALHPKVLDVAVIGVPDEEMGEAVKAVVQPAPGVSPGPDLERELLEYARDRMAHYKCPRSVDFFDVLPRTPTGKLVKRTLRERYLTAAWPSDWWITDPASHNPQVITRKS